MQERAGSTGRGAKGLSELEPEVRLLRVGRIVYLEGSVSSFERKRRLADLAAELPSVKKVVNRLRVVPASHRPDRKVKEEVLAALRMPPLGERDISVSVADGVVSLEGTVPDISTRIAAEAAAWSACGVRHVENRLDIQPRARLSAAAPRA